MANPTRRDFLADAGTCTAHLSLAMVLAPRAVREAWTRSAGGPVVAQEKFGRLEAIAPGIWALISTPLTGDMTTLCNGGIVAGSSGTLLVEGFAQPAGAAWVSDKARELTGRWPTHTVLTHYHGDHVNGLAGIKDQIRTPAVHVTTATASLVSERNRPADEARAALLAGAVPIDPTSATTLDLGGRQVTIRPASGHTPSDVSITVADPSVVFCGDLVWNGMFPNYMDATPSTLARTVETLRADRNTTYVPGHGPLAKAADFDRYVAMLNEVGRAARDAHGRGVPAADAAKAYALPPSLGEWVLFSDRFIEAAFTAWYRELG